MTISSAYRIAATVIDAFRSAVEQEAVALGLLRPGQLHWRQEQARAEVIGGLPN